MSRRRICKALAACLVLATLLSAFPAMAAGTEAADSVYRNGNIYTVDEAFSKATALAIKGDRLVYVGGEAGVEAYIGPDTKVVDLGGETVIPGLVEGHMHVAGLGSSLMNLDCFWMPKQAILDLVKAAAEQAKPGEWIQGLDEHSMGGHQLPYKGGVGRGCPKQPSIPDPGMRAYGLGQ